MILSINPGSSSLKYKLYDASLNVVSEDNINIENGATGALPGSANSQYKKKKP